MKDIKMKIRKVSAFESLELIIVLAVAVLIGSIIAIAYKSKAAQLGSSATVKSISTDGPGSLSSVSYEGHQYLFFQTQDSSSGFCHSESCTNKTHLK